MFEHFDYNFMLERMMLDVKENYPELDYREGSMIHNAIAASALELSMVFITLDNLLDQSFIETADRTNLYRLSEQVGIDTSVFDATKGIFKCEFDKNVEIGSIWRINDFKYKIIKYLGSIITKDDENPDLNLNYYVYECECQTPGPEPNSITGTLTKEGPSNNYTHSELIGAIVQGRDELSDDEIRKFYRNKVNGASLDGNKMQYEQWCEMYKGIGEYKVFPLWNGPNTVKVLILNEDNQIANKELVKDFQDYLDPGSTGMGDGKAPIGAIVTVATAKEKLININANIITKQSNTLTKEIINDILNEYFKARSFKSNYVSYSQVIAAILDDDRVENVRELTINGATSDVNLLDDEIPRLGKTEFTFSTQQ